MPIVENANEFRDDEEVKVRLLNEIKAEEGANPAESPDSEEWERDLAEAVQRGAKLRETRLSEYKTLSERTLDVKLSLVLKTIPEGRALFEELCLRLDINENYARILPGWNDLAGLLKIQDLKTRWVQTCVRPLEGLTRALLEMYTHDGGTLGELLSGLIQLQSFEIFESLKPKIYNFLKALDSDAPQNELQYFSILKGLSRMLPQDDPCYYFKDFSYGLKNYQMNSINEIARIESDRLFTSEYDETSRMGNKNFRREWKRSVSLKDKGVENKIISCNILLVFAEDGIAYAETVRSLLQGFEYEDVKAEVFRLNEVSLWYEVLTSPEACCIKWTNEADYIIPILTPQLLKDFHNGNVEDESLAPTSPILNRYIYTLARARFTESGSKNTMVRPIIPMPFLKTVGQHRVVKRDPLLRLVWLPLKEDRIMARARGMLVECRKKYKS